MKKLFFLQRRWFHILIGGVFFSLASGEALRITDNMNFLPSVILFGAFTVPAAFIAFVYEKINLKKVPLSCIGTCFFAGGAIGIITAGLLEYGTLQHLGILALLAVGIIEETSKLILPTVQYFRGRYRSEAEGLFLGIASGMGFAALETMGYGLVTAMRAQDNIGAVQELLFFRGLISPAGHAAWTGIVCAVIWRERQQGRHGLLNFHTAGAFVLAILLHVLWNTMMTLPSISVFDYAIATTGSLGVAAISLFLLFRRLRESRCYLEDTPGEVEKNGINASEAD